MILGTAGHIDHGKTALVRALTGVDTDRLPEEKRRGITIELGFAPLVVDGVGTIGIVDVPGHEAFIRTMLAGATGIDLALLVIAADEGLMPQTREHLAILGLLGVAGGVVAITKCDLADSDWVQLVEEDARATIAGGPLAGSRVIRCSATTGDGIAALRDAIRDAARAVPARRADDLFRMPLDRVFTVRGTGTVVTGTIWSGRVSPEASVEVLPAGVTARVRQVESHGAAVRVAESGARAAVALGGVDRAAIAPRGNVLVMAGDPWVPTRLLRADVALLDGARTLGPRTAVRFHLGTADVGARLVAVGGPVAPGARIPVRVSLDAAVVARAGDRFVLRVPSPPATIGGGVVTDPSPPGRRAKPWPAAGAAVEQRLRWLLAEAGLRGVPTNSLPIRLGVVADLATAADAVGAVRLGGLLFGAAAEQAVAEQVTTAVKRAHTSRSLDRGAPLQAVRASIAAAHELLDHVLAQMTQAGVVTIRDGFVARAGWAPGGSGAGDSRLVEAVSAALSGAGPNPPSVDELVAAHGRDAMAALKLLASRGEAVQVASDRFFAAAAAKALTERVREALRGCAGMTASELREKTGLTRKYLIPFLEYCDRTGVTVRRGDVRVLP